MNAKKGKRTKKEKIEKSKTSLYINKLTLDSLRDVAKSYNISQGDILQWAPLLFERIVKKSLERRQRSLATLRTLSQQIGASIEAIKSIAPHLSKSFDLIFQEIICRIIDIEEKAVNDKLVSGIGDYSEYELNAISGAPTPLEYILRANEGSDPPFIKDLLEMLGDVDPDSIVNILQNRQRKEDSHE